MDRSLIKQRSAYVPMLMSCAAMALVVHHYAIYGLVHEADEGAAAHVFQILMVTEVPLVAFFAIKWLPRAPREALLILALQAAAVIAAFAAVRFLT
jgi:hypothetical protein